MHYPKGIDCVGVLINSATGLMHSRMRNKDKYLQSDTPREWRQPASMTKMVDSTQGLINLLNNNQGT